MGRKFTNLLLFLAAVAAAVGITLYVGRGQRGVMIYNLIFLTLMVIIYMCGLFGGMYRLDNLAIAFRRATEELKSIFKRPGKADLSNLKVLDGIFDNRYLDRKLDNFTSSITNAEEGIGDLDDYINEEEIDIHVHKRLLEMVPDIFTSLGILGTFVGLVWGLKDFQTSDYASMTTSVASLVDGIKVAFLTSIYGIAFSIVYTAGMKTEYSAMSESLTDFMERFHAYVLPTAENESRNLLVASQKVQTNAMNQMARQFSTQLADSFEKVITPTFQKMNTSLDSLVSTVNQCQEDAVRQILDEFLRQMNSSFRTQFAEFGRSMEQLNAIQKENIDYTAGLYQNFSAQLSESYNRQDRAMQTMLRELSDSQNQYLNNSSRILKENQEIQRIQQQDYQHVVEYLKESEKSAAKFWVACNQAMQKYLEAAAASMEKAATTGELSQELISSNREIAKTFSENMQEYAQQQALTYKTMEKVRILLSDISAAKVSQDVVLVGNSNRNDTMARMERLLTEYTQNQQQLMEEMNKTLHELSKNMPKAKTGLFK